MFLYINTLSRSHTKSMVFQIKNHQEKLNLQKVMHIYVHTLTYFLRRLGKAAKNKDENLRRLKVKDIISVSVI